MTQLKNRVSKVESASRSRKLSPEETAAQIDQLLAARGTSRAQIIEEYGSLRAFLEILRDRRP